MATSSRKVGGSIKATRVLKVFKALNGHPIIGVSNSEISQRLNMTATQVTRDLQDLMEEGLVVRLSNGNFAYSVELLQVAERFRQQQLSLQRKLQQIGQQVGIE